MTFMSALLNIPQAKLMTEKSNYDGTSDIENDDDDDDDSQKEYDDIVLGNRYNSKMLKINGLFQCTMCFITGEKELPFKQWLIIQYMTRLIVENWLPHSIT